MSKGRKPARRRNESRRDALDARRPQATDASIYVTLVIIGLAVTGVAFLLTSGRKAQWGPVSFGYVIAIAWLINLYAYRAYQGVHLANWKQALARVPLRFAGFGTRRGKPLEAAHHAPAARSVLMVSAVLSVVLLAGLSFLFIPDLVRLP